MTLELALLKLHLEHLKAALERQKRLEALRLSTAVLQGKGRVISGWL